MTSNSNRREEARARLRAQMEAEARREKMLGFIAAGVVAVLILGVLAFVVVRNIQKDRQAQYEADWTTCVWGEEVLPEKEDPEQYADQGDEIVEQVEQYNESIDKVREAAEIREVERPDEEQPRRGTANVTFTFEGGDVPVTLDYADGACNVGNVVSLVEQQYFDDTECHRLTVSEEEEGLRVLQCGDPTGTGMGGPGYMVPDEPPAELAPAEAGPDGMGMGAVVYPRGTVAMAKSQTPDSAGSQFFLVYEDSALPPEYTVVGRMSEEGLEVVDEIADEGTKSDDPASEDSQKPAEEVKIDKAVLVGQEGLPER